MGAMRSRFPLLICLVVLSMTTAAFGSGFALFEAGAKAIAMGGAFAATADDPSAIFFNPAGIAQIRRGEILFGGTLINAGFREPWWPLVLGGLLSVAAGLVALKWPGITALALLLLIAYWSILRGILEIAAAVRLRHELRGEGWLILGGVASVVFGALPKTSTGKVQKFVLREEAKKIG